MKTTNPNKYYVYLRKSSEAEDKQVQSIERQHDEVMRLIEHYKLEIIECFQESRSAMTPNNRPEFTRMIDGIRQRKANGIICWHINRLARNPFESGIVQQLLEDGLIQKIITKDREYTASDNSIIYGVESSLATQYSKDLGKMVKSGMEKKIAKGIAPFFAPLGYLNTKRAEHGTNFIVPDPDRFAIVRGIWDLMLTGKYTPPAILQHISNKTGLTTKLNRGRYSVSRTGIYRILSNCFYAGLFEFKGAIYQGIHTPMITLDEFDRVQQLLGSRGKPRYTKHVFPFTGIITCTICGSAITATKKSKLIKSTGQIKQFTYYYCSKRKQAGKYCTAKPIPSDEFETIVYQELQPLSIPSDFKNLALRAFSKVLKLTHTQDKSISEYRNKQITAIERELKNLLSLRLSESISDDEFKQAKNEREKALLQLKNEQKSKTNDEDQLKELDAILQKVTNIADNFKMSEPLDKKSTLQNVGWNYTLNDKKLLFDKPNWLIHLTENKDALKGEFERLELDKSIETYTHLNDLWAMCPTLREFVDTVGTEPHGKAELKPLNHKKSYDYN